MEREKLTSLVVERQNEAPLKSAGAGEGRALEDAWLRGTGAEAEPASPAVGRWGSQDPERAVTRIPLPRARWGPPRQPLDLTHSQHEELATKAEAVLRRLLVTNNYDSVNNFLSLFDAYERSSLPLYKVFQTYQPPIRSKKHTCVGLGLELIKRWRALDKEFPGFAAATALLSCEEAVVDVREYVTFSGVELSEAEKEHVMVGVSVRVAGRPGVLLADPGYHVPRIVTVMLDRQYPHTGWFTQQDKPHCRKEYNYTFNPQNPAYVEWHEKETREPNFIKCQTSLVYVARPYLDGINVTEKRNLVYNFRSLLARDQKGHVVAGLYFPVGARGKDAQFTLCYDNGGGAEEKKSKYKFSTFLEPANIPDSLLGEIELCNAQMNYKKGELRNIICRLATLMTNNSFIDQMLEINEDICRLSL